MKCTNIKNINTRIAKEQADALIVECEQTEKLKEN